MKLGKHRFSPKRFLRRFAGLLAPDLLQQNLRLNSLIEQASDGIFVADLTGRYTYVNTAGSRMLGYAKDEILGKTIFDLIPPKDANRLSEEKARMVHGSIQISEWTLRCKDGRFIPVEISAKILADGRWQGFVRDLSESKRIASALQEVNGDLNRAQAVARVGSWRLNVQRNELFWSDENYRIFGIPLGQPMNYEDFLAHVHPDDRAYVDEKWKAAQRGEPYEVEHRILAGNDIRWVIEKADLQFDDTGDLLGGIGTTQDTTDQKRIEEALQKANETERSLRAELEQVTRASLTISEAVASLSSAEVSAVLHAIVLQAQSLTGAQYAALGIGGSETSPFDPWVSVGMSQESAKALGHAPRPIGTLGAVAREGKSIREKDIHKHPAFRGFPAGHPDMRSFLGVPIRYRGVPMGNIYLANKVGAPEFTDQDYRITQMLAARVGVAIETASLYRGQALRHAWLQTVIDQMPEGVVLLDENGRISASNKAMVNLSCGETGASDPFGNPLRLDPYHPDGRPVAHQDMPLVRAMKSGEIVLGEEFLMRQIDGGFVPVLINAAPVRGPNGDIVGATAIVHDISKLKELERLREEWASIIAHDLRQPASVISLAVEMLATLREGELPAKEQKLLSRIHDASGRLNRMINDLLEGSQVETRRLAVVPQRRDIVGLVREVVEQQLDATRQNIVLDAPPRLEALFDADRTRQVIENLLSNAMKYGFPGMEIRVEILELGNDVEVIVTNRGPGISPDELGVLFDRFSRTRDAKKGVVPGLGLGLYISNGIVEAQGGRMWVESNPGEMTSFHFTIPRPSSAQVEAEAEAHEQRPAEESPSSLGAQP